MGDRMLARMKAPTASQAMSTAFFLDYRDQCYCCYYMCDAAILSEEAKVIDLQTAAAGRREICQAPSIGPGGLHMTRITPSSHERNSLVAHDHIFRIQQVHAWPLCG